jgi:hypothetical protein
MAKKTATTPRVKVSYSSCKLVASWDMNCPLCGVLVEANSQHSCTSPDPDPGEASR